MRKAIYEAMKVRIETVSRKEMIPQYEENGWAVEPDAIFYKFNANGLGEDIDSIVQPMSFKNIWNIAQRFYGFLRAWHGKGIDERLLKGIDLI